MIVRPDSAQRLDGALARAGHTPAVLLLLAVGLAGCHHKTAAFTIPQGAHAPVALETLPPPVSPPMIATLPKPELPPLPLPPPPPPPAPRKRPVTKEEIQPTVQVPVVPETAAVAIGALTAGGDATPQSQQQARDLIASLLKRIAALPVKTAEAQRKQLRQVRNFIDQAQKALNSGDAEGAKNLATKASLLMDDLEKK